MAATQPVQQDSTKDTKKKNEETAGNNDRKTITMHQRRRRSKRRTTQSVNSNNHQPPWRTVWNDATSDNLVTRYVHKRQQEAWNEFCQDVLEPLITGKQDHEEDGRSLLQVLECLYTMGIARPVLEHAAQVICGSPAEQDEALAGLAQFLAHGVTRAPTPFGISQRLAVLHVICTFREQREQQQTREPGTGSERATNSTSIDPVLLWHFVLGDDSNTPFDTNDETTSTDHTGPDSWDVWCWELRALTLACLKQEEEERRRAHATADQLAHAVGMAAVTVELGLSQSTQLVCRGMGRGCEWIKSQLGSPKYQQGNDADDEESLEQEGFELVHNEEAEETMSEASSWSSVSSEAPSAVTTTTIVTATSQGSANKSVSSKKTKDGIVKEAYTSYSRTARHATDAARETTQTYVQQFKEASGEKFLQAAQSSRAWATEHVHANHQHWAYLDAVATVSLASLGAVAVIGEAMFHNTQVLLDHSASVTTDLIQHQFGPTAAHVFANVSRTTTNVTRMTAQVAGLASPALVTKAVVKQAGKEKLREQHAQEQTLRQQQEQQQQPLDPPSQKPA